MGCQLFCFIWAKTVKETSTTVVPSCETDLRFIVILVYSHDPSLSGVVFVGGGGSAVPAIVVTAGTSSTVSLVILNIFRSVTIDELSKLTGSQLSRFDSENKRDGIHQVGFA